MHSKTRRTPQTKARRHIPAVHKFDLDCECETCRSIRNEVAFAHDRNCRWEKMMTPVAHCVYDDRYLDNLMTKLCVPDDDYRADVRQALIDTAEPGKDERYWILDAALVAALRRGEIEEPPPGSPGARYMEGGAETAS